MKKLLVMLTVTAIILTSIAEGAPAKGKAVSTDKNNSILIFNKYASTYAPLPETKRVLIVYTNILLANLQVRNPIEDAKLAIRNGKIFILLRHHGFFDPKNLPTLQSIYTSKRNYKTLHLQGYDIKLNTRIELLNKYELNRFNEFYNVMKRYTYYWNRTVIHELLKREKTKKRKLNQYYKSTIKPINKLPFTTKWRKYEVLVNSLPVVFPRFRTNTTYYVKYYKKLYMSLRARNPISDAKLALANKKIFLLSYNGKYRKNRLGLPPLQRLGERYKHKGLKYHLLQGVTNLETIKFYEKSLKEEPRYIDEYLTYKKLVDRYSYYWNRTIIHAIVTNKI